MVALVTLPEHTTGAEICKAVVNELSIRQIHISKVVSVTTDGTLSKTGEKAEFLNVCKRCWSSTDRFSLPHT